MVASQKTLSDTLRGPHGKFNECDKECNAMIYFVYVLCFEFSLVM